MKKVQKTASVMLPALVLIAAIFSGQLIQAQNAREHSGAQTTPDQQKMQPEEQNTSQKTFTGTIVKSGNKLVLTDGVSKTSYQLDDQQKAQDFVNKNVKVTGVLDPATGTIRVTAIDPV